MTLRSASLVGKNEGQIEDFEVPHAERPELGERGRQHLHGAELQGFELFLVLVELRVGIDLNPDLAGRVFLGKFLELVGGLALGRIRRARRG